MILHNDVTHYSVGTEQFDRTLTREDARGITYYRQGYYLALARSHETGLPVVAHGPNSRRVPGTKNLWELVPQFNYDKTWDFKQR